MSEPVPYASPAPAKEDAAPLWMKRVPMITGVLAGLAGFLTVKGANLSNQAIYRSNQAVLHQATASDKWAEYQADSIKRHIDQTALKVGVADPAAKADLEKEQTDLKARQPGIRDLAVAEEAVREQELKEGEKRLAVKDLLDYAGVAAQLGIALASVAALTKKKEAFSVGLFVGVLAVAITAYALISPYFIHP